MRMLFISIACMLLLVACGGGNGSSGGSGTIPIPPTPPPYIGPLTIGSSGPVLLSSPASAANGKIVTTHTSVIIANESMQQITIGNNSQAFTSNIFVSIDLASCMNRVLSYGDTCAIDVIANIPASSLSSTSVVLSIPLIESDLSIGHQYAQVDYYLLSGASNKLVVGSPLYGITANPSGDAYTTIYLFNTYPNDLTFSYNMIEISDSNWHLMASQSKYACHDQTTLGANSGCFVLLAYNPPHAMGYIGTPSKSQLNVNFIVGAMPHLVSSPLIIHDGPVTSDIELPRDMQVNESATYTLDLENTGVLPVTNLNITTSSQISLDDASIKQCLSKLPIAFNEKCTISFNTTNKFTNDNYINLQYFDQDQYGVSHWHSSQIKFINLNKSLSLSPNALYFNNYYLNDYHQDLSFTITNHGTVDVTQINTSLDDSAVDHSAFVIESGCNGVKLSPESSCVVTVSYHPSTSKSYATNSVINVTGVASDGDIIVNQLPISYKSNDVVSFEICIDGGSCSTKAEIDSVVFDTSCKSDIYVAVRNNGQSIGLPYSTVVSSLTFSYIYIDDVGSCMNLVDHNQYMSPGDQCVLIIHLYATSGYTCNPSLLWPFGGVINVGKFSPSSLTIHVDK